MTRDDPAHLLRVAGAILGADQIVVVGPKPSSPRFLTWASHREPPCESKPTSFRWKERKLSPTRSIYLRSINAAIAGEGER